jgi:hypothetical protein
MKDMEMLSNLCFTCLKLCHLARLLYSEWWAPFYFRKCFHRLVTAATKLHAASIRDKHYALSVALGRAN